MERRLVRESLLEMKRLSDEYTAINQNSPDLFTEYALDPVDLFREDRINISGLGDGALTIEEPSLTDFYQYGLECRYLPLYRFLQASKKAVLTSDWLVAREELMFSKGFDRLMELRGAKSLSVVLPKKPAAVAVHRPKSAWDGVLESARWMWLDVSGEREWKRSVAQTLAGEAVEFLKRRVADFPKRPFVYTSDVLNYLDRDTLVYEGNEHGLGPDAVQEHLSRMHKQWQEPANADALCSEVKQGPIDSEWTAEQDLFLCQSGQKYQFNYDLLGESLKKSAESVRSRLDSLVRAMEENNSVEKQMAAKHFALASAMSGSKLAGSGKSPLTISAASKKLASALLTTHPSHEAAVRKANQNINKLLTPSELALKRLQKNRVMTSEIVPPSQ